MHLRSLTRRTHQKIAQWIYRKIRTRARNKTDPITLEDLSFPCFKCVTVTFVHGFDPDALADYFITSGRCINPCTREPFLLPEIRRLTKMVNNEKADKLHNAFLRPSNEIYNVNTNVADYVQLVRSMLTFARADYVFDDFRRLEVNRIYNNVFAPRLMTYMIEYILRTGNFDIYEHYTLNALRAIDPRDYDNYTLDFLLNELRHMATLSLFFLPNN